MVFENVDFYSALDWFEGIGGFDIVLPFLLIFTIIFALLQKIQIFDKKNINVLISLIIAFFLVIQKGLVEVIQGFLPRVSMIVLVVFMFLLVLGIFTGGSVLGGKLTAIAGILSIIAIFWALGYSFGWNVPLSDWFTQEDVAILIVIGVFVLVIWLIVKEGGEKKGIGKRVGGFLEDLSKEFGKSK